MEQKEVSKRTRGIHKGPRERAKEKKRIKGGRPPQTVSSEGGLWEKRLWTLFCSRDSLPRSHSQETEVLTPGLRRAGHVEGQLYQGCPLGEGWLSS